MKVSRDVVVSALREAGHHDRAVEVACDLPAMVDTEQDAGVLADRDVDVGELEDLGSPMGHHEPQPRAGPASTDRTP